MATAYYMDAYNYSEVIKQTYFPSKDIHPLLNYCS